MELQAHYSVKANGKEVAAQLRDRIAEVRVTLRTGLLSDTCYVKFDNLGNLPITAPKGAEDLEIGMGYKQGTGDNSAPIVEMGKYSVGEYQLIGPVRALELHGNKVIWDQELKTLKFKSWPSSDDAPLMLADVISEIAGQYGLSPCIADSYQQIQLPQIEQSESDMQLLSKLAEQFDAFMKIVNDKLIFMNKGTGRSLSGQALPEVALGPKWLTNWILNAQHYKSVGEVKAKFYDFDIAELKTVNAGSKSPSHVLPYVFANEAIAQAAADSKLNQLKRSHKSVQLHTFGKPDIVAGGVVEIEDVADEINGRWYVNEVEHVINGQGFYSYVSCEALAE
ncbi:phage late control D family protein [Pseudoalteromonas luteoviolacea]|nr:contractile injection system protein, VgrG/Pvc8 family [Pseudoalteromonas luteoviolacea]